MGNYRFGFMRQIREIAQTGQSVIWVSRGNIPGSYIETDYSEKKVRMDIEKCLSSYDYKLIWTNQNCQTFVHVCPEPVMTINQPEVLNMISSPVRIDLFRVAALCIGPDGSIHTITWNISWNECPENVLTVQDIMQYPDYEIWNDLLGRGQ